MAMKWKKWVTTGNHFSPKITFGESFGNHWPLRIPMWWRTHTSTAVQVCTHILNAAHFHIREQFLIDGFFKVLRFHFHLHLWNKSNAEINFTKHSMLFPRETQTINYGATLYWRKQLSVKSRLRAWSILHLQGNLWVCAYAKIQAARSSLLPAF